MDAFHPAARDPPHAIFLSDYDMLLTEHLVQGVDVWINTPRRPWEACGTSGMKVLVNGGIICPSWMAGGRKLTRLKSGGHWRWPGTRRGPSLGRCRSRSPLRPVGTAGNSEFYTRGENGIPAAWVARMRESMARLTPVFAASRAVREYLEQHYLPPQRLPRARGE